MVRLTSPGLVSCGWVPPWTRGVAVCLAVVGAPEVASAQPLGNIPLGGRSATMGGAATAAGNDGAMPYVNPAGLAGLPRDVLAVSGSAYAISRLKTGEFFYPSGFEREFQPAQVDRAEVSATTTFQLPTSVMYMTPVRGGKHSLGVSLVIPRVIRQEINATSAVRFPAINGSLSQAAALARNRTEYYLGPTYAFLLGDRLRLGASLFTVYVRDFRLVNFQSTSLLSGGSLPGLLRIQRNQSFSSTALAAVFGAQLRVAESVWAGLALESPSLPLGGSSKSSSEASAFTTDAGGAAAAVSSTATLDGEYRHGRPLRMNFGLARDRRDGFSVAVDGQLGLARKGAERIQGTRLETAIQSGQTARTFPVEIDEQRDLAVSWGFAAGVEVPVASWFSARLGGFYGRSEQPAFSSVTPADLFLSRFNRAGASAGLGLRVGSFDTTFGAVYSRETGQFVTQDTGVSSAPLVPIRASTDSLFLILSGATSVEEARKQIQETVPGGAQVLP